MWRTKVLMTTVMAGAASLVLIPAAAAQAAQAAQGASWKQPAVVSIGDSYISGEAGRWKGNSPDPAPGHAGTDRAHIDGQPDDPARVYGTTAGTCDRSDVAPIISATLPFATPINLACSGAKTVNVLRAASGGVGWQGEAPQNDQLAAVATRYRVKLIALSIGGNDLGFSAILQSCVAAYLTPGGVPCSQTQQATLDARLPAVATSIEAVIDDTRATMAAAGYSPRSYRFIFQSYPSPLASSADNRYPQAGAERTRIGGCPFLDQDADWAQNTLIPRLTATQAQAVQGTGVQFLNLAGAVNGHQLCDRDAEQPVGADAQPVAATSEWIRFIDLFGQGTTSESLHPNYFGQRAIGRCLTLAVLAGRDVSCTATPGAGLWGIRLAPVVAQPRNPARQTA